MSGHCECMSWARVAPVDLRGFEHHSQCPKFSMPVYADISLEGGGRYVVPVSDIGVLVDEISEAAACGSIESKWTISLKEMSPVEYAKLPEFTGH